MKRCIVVIPVYKQTPDLSELASFRQVLRVLHRHDIALVTFRELDISAYLNEAQSFNKELKIEYFDSSYFASVVGYNRLCLEVSFYKRFLPYEYMLIYQLDAWVFRDELEYWCDQGYDYIGAPWFTNWGKYEDGEELWAVGNGGFSLRRVSFCHRVLTYRLPISFFIDVHHGIKPFFKSILKSLGIRNTVRWYISAVSHYINEDFFLTHYIPYKATKSSLKSNLPTIRVASNFSFERSPEYLYHLNNCQLPFGCHAFMKYDFDSFWTKYITI